MSKLTCHYPLYSCTFLSSGSAIAKQKHRFFEPEKQWKPKAEPNLFELCWGASCFAQSEKQRFFEPKKQWKPSAEPKTDITICTR